jgi:hypothetical protein
MQEVVDWLNILAMIILLAIIGVVMVGFILLWTPFLLLGMALDYYDNRKTIR